MTDEIDMPSGAKAKGTDPDKPKAPRKSRAKKPATAKPATGAATADHFPASDKARAKREKLDAARARLGLDQSNAADDSRPAEEAKRQEVQLPAVIETSPQVPATSDDIAPGHGGGGGGRGDDGDDGRGGGGGGGGGGGAGGDDGNDDGGGALNDTGRRILAYIERIERVQADIDALNQDRGAIYAEAKAEGFDNDIIRRIVKIRRMEEQTRREKVELLDTYLHGIGMGGEQLTLGL